MIYVRVATMKALVYYVKIANGNPFLNKLKKCLELIF